MPKISIKAETLFEIGGFNITNSLLTSWLSIILILFFVYFYNRKAGRVYLLFRMILNMLYSLYQPILGKWTEALYPFAVTIFLFVLSMNWLGLMPGVGSFGLEKVHGHETEFVPLLRAGTADLNTTLALAIVVVVMLQVFAIRALGVKKYLKKFFNFNNPINAFVGILELVSEISKVISFSFRLFGNVFAGEVLLTVISFLVPVLISFPFLAFEYFIGFIQALVFSMLFVIFFSVATTEHH